MFIEHHMSNVSIQYMSCQLFYKKPHFFSHYSRVPEHTYYSQKDASIIYLSLNVVSVLIYAHQLRAAEAESIYQEPGRDECTLYAQLEEIVTDVVSRDTVL